MREHRLVVLVSGNGSNLQAILDAVADGRIQAKVACVVSNREGAFALQRAEDAGVPTLYAPRKRYPNDGRSRVQYDADLGEAVERYLPDTIVLAGWMHVLSPAFLDRFPGAVINLHPALPGEYPGVDAIARAWADAQAGRRDHTGIMVHEVVPEIDAGPVLGTVRIEIEPGESLDSLTHRMHRAEHGLIVDVLARRVVAPR